MDKITSWLTSIDVDLLTKYAIEYGVGIVTAILVFVFGRWLAKGITRMLKHAMTRAKLDNTLVSFLGNISYGLLLTFVVIAALSQLGIETTSLAAILAAAGLAIGLALQGSLSNFAAGVMIIAFRPFKSGDFVNIAGVSGTVEEVHITTTNLRTPDNKAVIVPNSDITGSVITNFSAKATRRLDLVFGISYDDDIRQAKEILKNIVEADERILKDPEPVIGVLELADNSVNFAVRPWVKSSDYLSVQFSLMEDVKYAFDAAGISIPYPQRDVHLYEARRDAA